MTQQAPTRPISIPGNGLEMPTAIAQVRTLFPALTLEVGLFAAITLVALLIRLLFLDLAPLSSDEAQQAISAWHFVNGQPSEQTGSPLLFAADSLLFFLAGAHDLVPRLLPALVGGLLVLLPFLLRRDLGRIGALIASALLAFSPTLVFFSRVGNGAIIAVTCGLFAIAFAWRYLQDRRSSALSASAILAAFALLSAQEIWTLVLMVLLFVAVWVLRSRRVPYAMSSELDGDTSDGGSALRLAGILFLLVFLGVSTVFLFHREGAGAAFDLFGTWLAALQIGGTPFDPLRVLVIYEPLVLFFGFAAIIHLFFDAPRDHRPPYALWFLAVLAIGAFLIYSFSADKDPARLVVLVAPLGVLVGWYIGDWFTQFREDLSGEQEPSAVFFSQYAPVFLFALALAGFLYFVFAEFSTRGSVLAAELVAAITHSPASAALNGAVLTGLIAVAAAAIGFLSITTLGWTRAKHLFVALALTILSLWSFRQMALVSFSGDWNPRDWLVSRATSPNIRDLVFDLEDISRWRANDTHTLTILADESLGPVVRWYLRDFVNAKFESHPVMIPGIQALLVPPNAPVNSANLMSQRYTLESSRGSAPDTEFFQWLLFRRTGNLVDSDAVLWIPQLAP